MDRVVYYARVSTAEEQQLNALEDQIKEIIEFIGENENWSLVDQYIDEGKSGTTTKHRKEYNRLIQDIEEDKFDIIVIKDETRLNRNVFEWYKFIDILIRNDKKLFFYIENKYYKAEDKFLIGIKALMAEQYSKDLSIKINNAHLHRQKKGKVCTNSTILGYDLLNGALIINAEQSQIVEMVYDLYIAGIGFATIAKKLDELAIKNARGNKYDATSLKRIVINEKYKGALVSNKKHYDFETKKIYDVPKENWIIKEDVIPQIIDKEKWEKANKILDTRRQPYVNANNIKKIAGHKTNTYIYTGKIICGECNAIYWHETRKKCKSDIWQCHNYRTKRQPCKNEVSLRCDVLDNLMKYVINDFWKNKDEAIKNVIRALEESMNNNDIDAKRKDLTNKKDKYNNMKNTLIDLLSQELINKDEYINKKLEYENIMQKIDEELDESSFEYNKVLSKQERLVNLNKILNERKDDNKIISDDIIKYLLNKIVVKNNNQVDVYLNTDIKYIVNINKDNFSVLADKSSYK
ncbi:recombinase family protein [Clostridium tagluense]|uniref:recombinase family protein n=1 Tax=Clostridium tagluense TaxID=360422 RepID=UPI001C6F4B73|nr:recombinase family protein [Clostridium tagluense]MBW9156289.1 recombinase family protein [Clostridium tagluense]WLC64295.1 recombinase family protein [Clostridium tagluense]